MKYRRFPLGALWTNGYLFWDDTNEAFFIDPGGEAGDVLKFLKEHNLNLRKVLLTHGHADHIAGVHDLKPIVGGEIYVGKNDAHYLSSPSKAMEALLGIHYGPIEHFHEVSEGDVLHVGKMEIQVMETPGHTEGGVCYLIKEGGESLLASGDTLFAQSVGRTDLEGGDQETLNVSLARLAEFPDGLHVLPGHGPETSIGEERKFNPFWPEKN